MSVEGQVWKVGRIYMDTRNVTSDDVTIDDETRKPGTHAALLYVWLECTLTLSRVLRLPSVPSM